MVQEQNLYFINAPNYLPDDKYLSSSEEDEKSSVKKSME